MVKLAVPDEKGKIKYEESRDPEQMYFEKLQKDKDFQKYIVNGLFDLSDYANILNMETKMDMEKLGKTLLIRQEVILEIQKRLSPLVQSDEDML